MVSSDTLVLDNGACYIKAGLCSQPEPLVMRNAVMKARHERRHSFVGNQIDRCSNLSSLFYMLAFQRGYLVNWDVQKTVWDHMFGEECLALDSSQHRMLVTEPCFNFGTVHAATLQMLFEQYDVPAVLCCRAADVCAVDALRRDPCRRCCTVVDAGFSFTHVVPFIDGEARLEAVRRVDVGGKALTNYAKDIISYRQLHVMDETHVIAELKEDCCYVTDDWQRDMRLAALPLAQNSIACDYVLPDFSVLRRGKMRSLQERGGGAAVDGEQLVRLANERFSIPELLFRPSDAGIDQMGVAEALMDAVNACPLDARSHLLDNIVLTGGSTKFAGFAQRLQSEVRSMAPDDLQVRISAPLDPLTHTWHAATRVVDDPLMEKLWLTKKQWEEQGEINNVEATEEE
nr:actin-related protein 6 [Parasacculina yatsui]